MREKSSLCSITLLLNNSSYKRTTAATRVRATNLSLANRARFHCATTLPSEKISIFTYFNQIDSF